MTRLKGMPLWSAIAVIFAAPAFAQIAGRPIEISGGGGFSSPDARDRVEDGLASFGTLGWRWHPGVTLEAQASFAPSHADTLPGLRHNFSYGGLDLRWSLRSVEGRTVPFILTGVGYGSSHAGGARPEKLERGAGSLGFGLLLSLWSQRSYLRLQVRDVWFRGREAREFSNQWMATGGLQLSFGGKPRDSDLDGVRDWLDQCPQTPIGATVDAKGCPSDSDGDRVYSGLDQCEGTPRGCTVDKKGCPADADGDGVCDGLDQCADTPRGASVDAKGCPFDRDGDGVLSGIDQCQDTPKGCTVDSLGCPADADSDGVCDGLDQCANTTTGLKVDASGCPIEVGVLEIQLLDTGSIRLQNILFDTGKATIKPESFALIDSCGRILQQYPTLRIEIGGHTDTRGSRALNDSLSDARAVSVLDHLRQNFPSLDLSQYSAKGYGFSVPIAPNTTALGRAKNRRVEFKVMNTEALRIEREKRHFLRQDEGAPPDTTRR